MSSVIHKILTDEFVDLVSKEVLMDYYETLSIVLAENEAKAVEDTVTFSDMEHNIEVMNALTTVLREFLPPDDFHTWLMERDL
jgi:hypothetical protein|tara:strand:- start:1158 stop:1406 length:249 start_codon:yes stop_codon:yes gene_type:complete